MMQMICYMRITITFLKQVKLEFNLGLQVCSIIYVAFYCLQYFIEKLFRCVHFPEKINNASYTTDHNRMLKTFTDLSHQLNV